MTEQERRKLGQFGYKPQEQRGYKPDESKPQPQSDKNTMQSTGNVSQDK